VKRYRQVAGFILAGGASSRMGRDKGLLDFSGVPLILHTARLLDPLVAEVTVVGTPTRYASLGLSVIADADDGQIHVHEKPEQMGRGPLAGIATALSATHLPWNLIVACDLPYLSAKWVSWLLSRALRSHGDVVIPRTEFGMEPLAAVYGRECRVPIAAAVARGVRKVSEAIESLRADVVHPHEWREVEPSELILKNMNAPGDYEDARQWWSAERTRENAHVTKPHVKPRRKQRSVPRQRK
jgi:molybdopterin-guanine dinucleotide biosynthesis protein A